MTDLQKTRIVYAKDQLAKGAVILDGLDSAIIGHSDCGRLIYSEKETIKEVLRHMQELDAAQDWIKYNILPLQKENKGFIYCHGLSRLY